MFVYTHTHTVSTLDIYRDTIRNIKPEFLHCKHCDHLRKSVASRVYMYAYLMRYCLICIVYFIFETKCDTKSISLNMKINLVEIDEDIYKGKKSPIHL